MEKTSKECAACLPALKAVAKFALKSESVDLSTALGYFSEASRELHVMKKNINAPADIYDRGQKWHHTYTTEFMEAMGKLRNTIKERQSF